MRGHIWSPPATCSVRFGVRVGVVVVVGVGVGSRARVRVGVELGSVDGPRSC